MNKSFPQEDYDRELEALFLRFPSVQNVPFSEAYKPGLERMIAFNEILGRPDSKFRTVHVAGTNGKGSVSNMLASALSAHGHKTGLFTSPHIEDFRERMRIAGGVASLSRTGGDASSMAMSAGGVASLVPKDYVYDFILRYKSDFERLALSFFEITTGMAFKWFADEGCDYAVIEVGLGGRLDSTNIVTPELSVITSIGLDHCDLLGHTLPEIAGEKAGIIKPGRPVVIGEDNPETRPVFEAKAREAGSRIVFVGSEGLPEDGLPAVGLSEGSMANGGPSNRGLPEDGRSSDCRELEGMESKGLEPEDRQPKDISLAGLGQPKDGLKSDGRESDGMDLKSIAERMDLRGKYQTLNLRTASTVLELLGMADSCSAEAIVHTAARMGFHGRWERLSMNPEVICDIGHNAPALCHNFAQLEEMMASGKYDRLIVVYAVMADKDLDAIIPLMPRNAVWHFATPATRRALPARKILERVAAGFETTGAGSVGSAGSGPVVPSGTGLYAFDAVDAAVDAAMEKAGPDSLVYIGGSTFAVAEALPKFMANK